MSNMENLSPQILRSVLRELQQLAADPPAGIKLVVGDNDVTDVVALIEGPAETPYCGGVFRVRLALGSEFPARPPRAHFLTKIFHPNVSAAGEVCVNTLQADWRPELGLRHALLAVRCLLIAPNAESALNAEAAALLRDHYDAYCRRARLYTDIHAGATSDAQRTHHTQDTQDTQASRRAAPAPAGDAAPGAKRERRAGAGPQAGGTRPAADRRRILKRL